MPANIQHGDLSQPMKTNETQWINDFVDVAIANLVQIEANLRKLGYKFANAEGPIKLIPPNTNPGLAELRQKYDQIPEFFSAWYDRVEFVDFSQDEDQLWEPSDHPVAGLGYNCMLTFDSLSTRQDRQAMIMEEGRLKYETANGREFVPFGAGASNNDPTGIWLPDSSSDPVIYNDGGGPITMSYEISRSIRAGGFPFWELMFRKRKVRFTLSSIPKYREILPLLLEGVVDML
jgi:hypothetical protein